MNNGAKIFITGDFCPINRISDLVSCGRYDSIFNDLLPFIKKSDLAITNLECPLTESTKKINKIGPSLKASAKVAEVLSDSGFKLVTLANNHIMDYGLAGLRSTLAACEKNGINWVGVGEDYHNARRIHYYVVGKYTVAILNFAENEFSTTNGNYPGANPLDPVENYRDICEAKTNSDYVIVIVHAGHEEYELPSPRIKETLRFYAEAGASAILSHHTHCYSGYEIYKGVPIFYGLGNFVFDVPGTLNNDWNYGFAVEFTLNGTITFKIIPFEQCNQDVGVRLLNEQGKEIFYKEIDRLNSIILNNDLLNSEFDKYCKKAKKMYFSYLEPHSIAIFHYLRNRKIFPSLLSKRKRTLFLNILRCESHRDVLIRLLDKH
jgi:poly-gamma-glutamate capsule biosynthesis protein CapA/YwtB (metallophosphatase superfamily)